MEFKIGQGVNIKPIIVCNNFHFPIALSIRITGTVIEIKRKPTFAVLGVEYLVQFDDDLMMPLHSLWFLNRDLEPILNPLQKLQRKYGIKV